MATHEDPSLLDDDLDDELAWEASLSRQENLTPREHEILKLVTEGLRSWEIAERLGIAEHTVEAHLTNIYKKLGVHSRAAATTWFFRSGRDKYVKD